MKKPVYKHLSSLINARENCLARGNTEFETRHESAVESLVKNFLPSGFGVDCGTKLLWDESTSERLVFAFSYHHMNENGYYDGWTEHKAIVTPSLQFDYNLKIAGRDRNDVKEYLAQTFAFALDTEVQQDAEGNWSEVKSA